VLWDGNECGKIQVSENWKITIPDRDYERSKTAGEYELLQLSGQPGTCEAECTREIKYKIVMAKAALNQKLFYHKMGKKHKEEINEMLHSEFSFYGEKLRHFGK